jgi:hypothetical protein
MKFLTKKRIVLFLLFIFPLICFLILSTGKNNFTKLPVLSKNVIEISEIDSTKSTTLKNNVSVLCFIGEDVSGSKSKLLNLNEKIYKKFIDFKQFQIIAIYPTEKEIAVTELKNQISAFTDMKNWIFIPVEKELISLFYNSLSVNEPLQKYGSSNAFIIDKDGYLRGRTDDKDAIDGKLYGYNMNAVAVLKDKLKDDINVLYYEYYAAFKDKNKNKADRKEVGL